MVNLLFWVALSVIWFHLLLVNHLLPATPSTNSFFCQVHCETFFFSFSYDDADEKITQYERIPMKDMEAITIGRTIIALVNSRDNRNWDIYEWIYLKEKFVVFILLQYLWLQNWYLHFGSASVTIVLLVLCWSNVVVYEWIN